MEKTEVLREAQRLYRAGFGVHWLKPKSKVPVKEGWTGPTRDSWETLLQEYRNGYGLGVRLGNASRLDEGFLANIDIDIKSKDDKHRQEALEVVEKHFPGLLTKAVSVKTGRGLRLFCVTEKPIKSRDIDSSSELCLVHMPSDNKELENNKHHQKFIAKGLITEEQYRKGFRIRNAWEVSIMSQGTQIVLPPSVHPDTGTSYVWEKPYDPKTDRLTLLSTQIVESVKNEKSITSESIVADFKAEEIDLEKLDSLPDDILQGILHGHGVDNRSDYLLKASIALIRAGLTKNQVLSVLSDPETFLGQTAYEHRQTRKRRSAVSWLWKYTVKKAYEEYAVENIFGEIEGAEGEATEEGISEEPVKDKTKADKENDQLLKKEKSKGKDQSWRLRLATTKEGKIQGTLNNNLIILENAVGSKIFRRDDFKQIDFYGTDAPWIHGKKGRQIVDVDALHISEWLTNKYKYEPRKERIYDAISSIASKNSFHPVKEYLESLSPWDCEERIDTWLSKHFNAKVHGEDKKESDEYLAQVFRKWLVASITRIYEPGTKFDHMPIIQGKTGTGKTYFCELLFQEKWYRTNTSTYFDKELAFNIQGFRVILFDEMAAFDSKTLQAAKSFITDNFDNFVGLTVAFKKLLGVNAYLLERPIETDLIDTQGNRRFWPIKIGMLDFGQLKKDRDQLWAEAFFIYQNGLEETLQLTGAALKVVDALRDESMVENEVTFMVDILEKFFELNMSKKPDEMFPYNRFKLTELFELGKGPFANYPQIQRNINYAAEACKLIKCDPIYVRGTRFWRYHPKT